MRTRGDRRSATGGCAPTCGPWRGDPVPRPARRRSRSVEVARLFARSRAPSTCSSLVLVGAVRRRRGREREEVAGHRGQPPHRGRVVRPDPARPRAVRVARRDRRRDRRGAGHRHRRRPRRRRAPPARDAGRSRRSCRPRAPGRPPREPRCRCRELEDPAADQAAAELAIAVAARPAPDRRPDRARSRGRSRPRAARDRCGTAGPARSTGSACAGRRRRRGRRHARPARRAGGPPQPTSTREGADQRIADRIADRAARRLRPAQPARRAAPGQRPDRGRHRPVAPDRRARGPAAPTGSSRRPPSRRPRRSARVYSLREAETRATTDALTGLPTAATSTSTWGSSPGAAAPRTRSAC